MVEVETGVVAVQLIQMLGALNLECVDCEISVLQPGGAQKKRLVGRKEKQDAAKEDEQSGTGKQAVHRKGQPVETAPF